jgi:hypothetical protein
MRIILLLLLSMIAFLPEHAQAQQRTQGQQSYAPPTYTLPSYTPLTYAPFTYTRPSYAPQVAPQSGEQQIRPKQRRRMVKCMRSDDPDDYCVLPAGRDLRYGAPCSCDGVAGNGE